MFFCFSCLNWFLSEVLCCRILISKQDYDFFGLAFVTLQAFQMHLVCFVLHFGQGCDSY